MNRNSSDENHQHYRDPVQRMFDDLKVDNRHSGRLALLNSDLGHHPQDGKAQSDHQDHRNPVGRVPGDYRFFRHRINGIRHQVTMQAKCYSGGTVVVTFRSLAFPEAPQLPSW